MALDEETGDGLGKESVVRWWTDTVGYADQGWICPDAPFVTKAKVLTRDTIGVSIGTVNLAWKGGAYPEGEGWFSSNFVPQNPASSRYRAGSYGLNGWIV